MKVLKLSVMQLSIALHSLKGNLCKQCLTGAMLLLSVFLLPGIHAQVSGTYTFSQKDGVYGDGSSETPFYISTPQDLLDLSAAVDGGLQYNGTNYYYNAQYEMINDIDMSEVIAGPFVMCTRTIYLSGNTDGTQDYQAMSVSTQIIQTTSSSSDSYTCNRMQGDTYGNGDNVTVSSSSSVTHESDWIENGKYYRYNGSSSSASSTTAYYKYVYEYTYYDVATSLSISSLMLPIGAFGTYKVIDGSGESHNFSDYNALNTFKGIFNGGGYTISNYTQITSSTVAGLFGSLSGATKQSAVIKDLTLTNANIINDGKYTGGIVGSLSLGTIENCSVLSSEITGGSGTSYAGGIAGYIAYKSGVSQGEIKNCTARDNIITAYRVGGISGYAADKETYITNSETNNQIVATYAGEVVGNGEEWGGYNSDTPDMDDSDIANVVLSNLVPDYCYINNGASMNPTDTKLEKLEKELNGTQEITDNLVLPDISKLKSSFVVDVETLYKSKNNGGGALRWYLNATDEDGHSYTEWGLKLSDLVKASDNGASNYGTVKTNGKTGAAKESWFEVNGAKFDYCVKAYYENWPAGLQNHVKEYYTNAINNLIDGHEKYYKVSASEITIDQNQGGGVLDKGNQLGSVTINFKRTFYTKNWNLEGYTQVGGDMYVGYLNNNANNNGGQHDMAALKYDYETNSWDNGVYLRSWNKTHYGEGLFVWPFDSTQLEDYNDPQSKGIWLNNAATVVTQKGNFVDYSTVNNALSEYINGLEVKGSASGDGNGYWFSLANPYIARLDARSVIAKLKGSGAIQGDAIYMWGNITAGAENTGSWTAYSDLAPNFYGGKGFIVGLSDAGKLNGVFSSEDLYGWNYIPGGNVSSSDEGSKKSAKADVKDDSQKMVFMAIDKYNRAKKISAVYGKGENGFDNSDAYAMLSGSDFHVTEPYFKVEGKDVWTNSFSKLPYETYVNFHSDNDGELIFAVTGNIGDLDVIFIDTKDNKETVMNEENIKVNVEKGENEGRYKVRFAKKSSSSINDIVSDSQANVKIWNNNKEINIFGEQLQRVDVMNMLGQTVYSRNINGDSYKFELNADGGAYIIKVNTANGSKSGKIVVK